MKKLLFVLLALPFIAFAQADVKIDKKYYQVNYSQKLKQPLSVDYGIRTRECNATRSGMDFFAEKGVITSSNVDYENNEWDWSYRENDPIGGADPYSSSKACVEIITNSYRHSFLSDAAISTARAGNVIGGGIGP